MLRKIRELNTLKSIVPKQYRSQADDVINLYRNKTINNIATARNLIHKLSATRPKNTIKKINDWKVRDHLISTAYEIVPPKKLSREQRLYNTLHHLSIPYDERVSEQVKKQKYHRTAFNETFKEITIKNKLFNKVYEEDYEQQIEKSIRFELTKALYSNVDSFKFKLIASIVALVELIDPIEKKIYPIYFNSPYAETITSVNMIEEWATHQVKELLEHIDRVNKKSNLVFKEFQWIKVQLSKNLKTRAGTHIETPPALKLKHAIVNIKNKDERCIVYALTAFKYEEELKKNHDTSNPKTYDKYIKNIIEPENQIYPIDVQSDIKKFEKLNNIKINVFQYEPTDKNFERLRTVYNNRNRNEVVCNLLLLRDEDKYHFCWIKSLSKLLRTNDNHDKRYWCSQCLCKSYETQDKLNQHLKICNNHEAVAAEMPKADGKENIIKFKNYNNMFMHPFGVYIDFESTLEEFHDDNTECDTKKYQRHKANSCGLKYNCIHKQYSEPVKILNNSDEDKLMKDVIEEIERLAIKSYEITKLNEKNIIITREKQNEFWDKQIQDTLNRATEKLPDH